MKKMIIILTLAVLTLASCEKTEHINDTTAPEYQDKIGYDYQLRNDVPLVDEQVILKTDNTESTMHDLAHGNCHLRIDASLEDETTISKTNNKEPILQDFTDENYHSRNDVPIPLDTIVLNTDKDWGEL